MFAEILSKTAQRSLDRLISVPLFASAYLAGGTALALQLGHRYSHDLDFFTAKKFDEKTLVQQLHELLPDFRLEKQEWRTVLGYIKNMRFSIFFYKYPLLFETHTFKGFQIADVRDIAPMKIAALADRGTKRDFIDLFFILEVHKMLKLEETFELYEKKFGKLAQNKVHILKSMAYFDDAKEDAMPHMIEKVEWAVVKRFFLKEQKVIAKKFLL